MTKKILRLLVFFVVIFSFAPVQARDVFVSSFETEDDVCDCYIDSRSINRDVEYLRRGDYSDVKRIVSVNAELIFRADSSSSQFKLAFSEHDNGTVTFSATTQDGRSSREIIHDQDIRNDPIGRAVWNCLLTEPDVVPDSDTWLLDWEGRAVYLKAKSFKVVYPTGRIASVVDTNAPGFECVLIYDNSAHSCYLFSKKDGSALVVEGSNQYSSRLHNAVYQSLRKNMNDF